MKTKEKVEHTPTPWKIIPNYKSDGQYIKAGIQTLLETWIGEFSSQDNATFIVRAVNSHEALLEAAKLAKIQIHYGYIDGKEDVIKILDDAIKSAEGEE